MTTLKKGGLSIIVSSSSQIQAHFTEVPDISLFI